MNEPIVESSCPAEGSTAELSQLIDRVARLEAQTIRIRTQAAQVEALRKLGSWDVDVATGSLTWSEGTYRIFGLPPGDAITVERALIFYPEASRAAISVALEAAIASGEPYDLTVSFVNAEGQGGWVRTIGQWQDTGGIQRIVGVIKDVTAEKLAQDRLRDLVYRDALTGLPNRRAFEARLTEIEAVRTETQVALFLLDVDNFKGVNDRFGHPVGDLLLREIADRLQRNTRPSDMVARLGGDEFGILLFDVKQTGVLERKASQLLDALRQTVETGDGKLHPTASIGVSHLSLASGPDGLFKCADVALYRAKALGRDRVEVFRSELRRKADQNAQVLSDVRKALDENQFTVFYQPIVDLQTCQVRGLEALVRWDHPERGILPPSEFGAALEDPILSVAVDDFVLQQALRQMRIWGCPLPR